jgi:hypothetical protein
MVSPLPFTAADIITKVRRIIARPSANQISDQEIIRYINTFYVYDMTMHLKLEPLRVNWQFTTTANTPVYDFPRNLYLVDMPPVFIGGYQSFMTQSRQNFFRINPQLNFLQQNVFIGNGTAGPYGPTNLINTPIMPGFKPNPPGAYSATPAQAQYINWNVLVSASFPQGNSSVSTSLVDDGQGNLIDPLDPATPPNAPANRGSINYLTGQITIFDPTVFPTFGFPIPVPAGTPINVQYIPYVPSRPQSACFYQDQILLYPVPDQAYTVSFEAFKYPIPLNSDPAQGEVVTEPQIKEWWQLLAYGAADKFFTDQGDLENMTKFRPLLEEQLKLINRRTIVQQTSERTATIYTEQSTFPQFPFGNLYSGF